MAKRSWWSSRASDLSEAHKARLQLTRSIAPYVWCCLAWLLASSAGAQDVQRFHPALSDSGFLGMDGTRPPSSWRGSVHLFSDLSFHPVELKTAGGQVVPVERRLMLHLGGEIGLGGRASLALRVPLIAYQDSEFRTPDAQVFTWTDPQIWARYRLIGANMDDDSEPHDGPGLTLQAGVTLPLGKKGRVVADDSPAAAPPVPAVAGYPFASDGRPRIDVQVLGDFQLLGAGAAVSLGYRHHFWRESGIAASATRVSDEFTFGAAVKVPIPPLPILATVIELRGVTGFETAASTALELDLGARLQLGAFCLVLGGGFGLTSGVGAPDGRVFLGAYFTPPRTDSDRDGVDDSDDACPYLAEDRDGFQDEDGCPDPDNDGDLVPDLDDKCPSQAAEEGHDEDEDGCTDAIQSAPAGAGEEQAEPAGAGAGRAASERSSGLARGRARAVGVYAAR